ncbi:hypothetical protein ACFQZ4_53480 [Catellatospora coxensis]
MRAETFRARLEYARSGQDARDNVAQIKRAVVEEIRFADPRVSVTFTDYFNHTFAPDLVLTWSGDNRVRDLFIRTDPDPRRLYDDVDLLGDKHPVLFSLGDVDSQVTGYGRLSNVAAQSNTLVTSAFGLDAVSQERVGHPVVQLASAALLQGGRGVVDEDEGTSIADAFSHGYEAALRADPESTARAAEVIDRSFDRKSSERLGQFLQAVWVGSGGSPTSFPGRSDVTSDLPDDAFRFLLELADFDDPTFWRRVGRNLTVERLARMDVVTSSPNFQYLIQGNLDVLRARVCRILSHDNMLFSAQNHRFAWTRDRGMLALAGERFTAYVAERSDDVKVKAPREQGITGDELMRRADSSAVTWNRSTSRETVGNWHLSRS